MTQAIPYLSFDGNCAEAMRFYAQVFDGALETLLSVGQSPMAAHMPAEGADSIMHACLVFDDGHRLYGGDCMAGQSYEGVKGLSLTMNYVTEAEAHRIFDALAEGGQIVMPMQPAFWARSWGMLTDRFGTPWIINGAMLPLQGASSFL